MKEYNEFVVCLRQIDFSEVVIEGNRKYYKLDLFNDTPVSKRFWELHEAALTELLGVENDLRKLHVRRLEQIVEDLRVLIQEVEATQIDEKIEGLPNFVHSLTPNIILTIGLDPLFRSIINYSYDELVDFVKTLIMILKYRVLLIRRL